MTLPPMSTMQRPVCLLRIWIDPPLIWMACHLWYRRPLHGKVRNPNSKLSSMHLSVLTLRNTTSLTVVV